MSRPHCLNNVVYGCGVPNMSNIGKKITDFCVSSIVLKTQWLNKMIKIKHKIRYKKWHFLILFFYFPEAWSEICQRLLEDYEVALFFLSPALWKFVNHIIQYVWPYQVWDLWVSIERYFVDPSQYEAVKNPYNAELFLYKPWTPKGVFQYF